MTVRGFALALCATLAAAIGVAATGTASEMLVLVTVVADDAQAATGLTPADFALKEDKDEVQVAEAVPADDPLSVVLLVDTALPPGAAASTPELRRAVTSFVATLQQHEPHAQVAMYQVANAATPLTDFTTSRAALDRSISSIASGNPSGSAMLEGVVTAARKLTAMPAPRRAIVCVGVGTAEGSSYLPDIVGGEVRKSGATLWVVSVQQATDPPMTNRDVVWTRATAESGGLRLNAVQASRLDSHLTRVANSLHSQYTLKIVRRRNGAVKDLKGQTAKGAPVLFTRWMR